MKTDWIAGFLGTWSTELTLGAILLRLALSMALAAIIGCERSSKRHSAGLRTFILVSLAGTSTMLIDQYLMDVLPITIPVLSAAAVIGITTISGNSILFSSKNQIKGLTTSVGLWGWRSARGFIRWRWCCLQPCFAVCQACQRWRRT